jgi:oxygen-independent coproporphyrinogen-3 oxidase
MIDDLTPSPHLGLYLHIPFCQAICSYCNFNRGLLDAALKRDYVDALEREIRASAERVEPAAGRQTRVADTIFFGGGTPSLLEPAEVARLIRACADAFRLAPDAEITLETNPETATPEHLDGVRAAGVTRISFGVQSFDDVELAQLGRVHSAARAREAIRAAKAAGFTSVSFDLMFWLPGQSIASWLRTVDEAVALDPNHLSLYLLELYPNAPIKESLARNPLASDDDAAEMYLEALSRLDAAGFVQYEISNVAKPGHWSRHNVKYWQGGNWRGFGCGAHSTVDGVRWKNVASTRDYIDRIAANAPVAIDTSVLSAEQRFEECLFTGLRLSVGVHRQEVRTVHGLDPWTRYGGRLEPFLHDGLMWMRGDRFGLTRPGMLVANEILATFV